MGSSCVEMTCFDGISPYFYQGVWLMLRWPKNASKMEGLVGFGQQSEAQT
jgi:hypothetical protein